MAVKKIIALDQFSHGRLSMDAGDTDTIEAVEARELEKARLVDIIDDALAAPELESAQDAGDTDTIEAGTKMEAAPENKMADEPMNKASKAKAK